MRALPQASAERPASTQPIAPLAMATNATRELALSPAVPPAAAIEAAANVGIHAHIA